ncbi:LysR family transcriptional regulator [Bacillus suaedaesalsae]|uniref:LysR family transcriptional regulator n=1 Tax=Bacillus suaedaesalsae TaxID=2810349 RepID=A0ABS2DII6_9BACI|nr:LysR family transcriptional regulator [Bacillus suaedaesalsae]MBM6617820.1 LysR family transcriptional regulator [Bacillus suaedaesalsae]
MDITYFQTFRAVVAHKSFTRAAHELGYAQSSVTMQIQKLEKFYGVKLFERYGKGLALTNAGEELLRIVVQILDLFQQSKERLSILEEGTLSIGTIDSIATYYLPSFIQKIRQRYPSLSIRLQPDQEPIIVEKVRDGEFDIGLLYENKPTDMNLCYVKIREEPLVLVANPNHPYASYQTITLDHLSDKEWIMPEASCNYRIMLERLLRENNINYNIGLELGNPEAIKRCLMTGFGISLLPRITVLDEIERGDLVVLPFAHRDIKLDLQLIIHPKKWIPMVLRDFMDLLN